MTETLEQKCIAKGVKLTDQRKIIAKVMSNSNDHPDVDELYKRVSKIDTKISIATVVQESDNLCDDECQPTWVHLTDEIGEPQQL